MSVGAIVKAKTKDGKGFRQSSYATDYIYQGKCHSISQRITVLSGTNMILLFDMTECTREVSVYPPAFTTTTGPLNIDFYAMSDYSGGTAMLLSNRLAGGQANQCTLTYSATGTNKGTLFSQGMAPAGHKQGATASDALEFVPPQKTKLLVELDNTNGTDATVLVQFVWFEV